MRKVRQRPWNGTSRGSNGSGQGAPVKRFLGGEIPGHLTYGRVCGLGLPWDLP